MPTPTSTLPILALVNGMLIDGTGAAPIPDAVLLIQGPLILAAGPRSAVSIPPGAQLIDVQGGSILPGFINAHVHNAYSAERLQEWARGGVTTVRDEGYFGGDLKGALDLRRSLASQPQYARLVSAGMMITAPGGYGGMYASSPQEARARVQEEAALGVEQIKFSLEDGYAGRSGLPKLSQESIAALIDEAHARGLRVSVHVTAARFLAQGAASGADDIAHVAYDAVSPAVAAQMVKDGIYLVPTLTVFEAYGSLSGAQATLLSLAQAGVQLGFGNDYTAIPQNGFPHFDLGMPMHEITRLSEAGLTPMQIIVSATRNNAVICGLEKDLGTLVPGKLADVLVVSGDPLQDLSALSRPLYVLHSGVIIRSP